MWEKGEKVILEFPVHHKKKEGTIYLTTKRLAWRMKGATNLGVSLVHSNFRAQHVSPASSAKIMLKLTVSDKGVELSYTFNFVSQNARTDREQIKDKITEILARVLTATDLNTLPKPTGASDSSSASSVQPQTRPAVSAIDLKIRQNLLSRNEELGKLHQQLVVSGHISQEEFWETRQHLLENQTAKMNQKRGQSSAWVNLKPTQQEGTDLQYTLTPEIIHGIFLQYPAVKRAYDDNVPDKLSEEAFWRRYFASKLFHRVRRSRSTADHKDDIFDKYLEEDEIAIANSSKSIRIEDLPSVLNLDATSEDHPETGNKPNFTMVPGSNSQPLSLIRRFNLFSEQILKNADSHDHVRRKEDIEKEILLPDLQENHDSSVLYLDIRDQTRYFENIGEYTHDNVGVDYPSILSRFKRGYEEVDLGSVEIDPFIQTDVSRSISRDIVNKRQAHNYDIRQLDIPPNVLREISSCQISAKELLRHFWASILPELDESIETARDNPNEKKAKRMIEALKKINERMRSAMIAAEAERFDLDKVESMMKPTILAISNAFSIHATRNS
ncbi:RNA polymerase II transcription factor B subunit 1 [Basidiobolus ranarum]|uniref:RNA polymerase II transcription factor B subunit 1 n=1 Tax=Basidiobolus ranarum TaxID=34480 RepID=A0ABR2WBR1_9FUNG